MSLTIHAPAVEEKLNKAAADKGIDPEDYAVEILSNHLASEGSPGLQAPAPFHAIATSEEWIAEFDDWLASHPKRRPLPDKAFDRASFYNGRS